jgi:hypothetical protein
MCNNAVKLEKYETCYMALSSERADQETHYMTVPSEGSDQETSYVALSSEGTDQETYNTAVSSEGMDQETRYTAVSYERADQETCCLAVSSEGMDQQSVTEWQCQRQLFSLIIYIPNKFCPRFCNSVTDFTHFFNIPPCGIVQGYKI